MATSGTYNTTLLDIERIVSKASSICGGQPVSGQESKEAREYLDLLLIDIENREAPLANLERISIPLQEGVREYSVAPQYIAVFDTNCVRQDTEIAMTSLSLFDYHAIPSKGTRGRPTQYTVEKDRENMRIHVWPTPENSTDTLSLWVLRQTQDSSAGIYEADMSKRFTSALVFGLAWLLSFEREVSELKQASLKAEYEAMLKRAFDRDGEEASVFIRPGGRR